MVLFFSSDNAASGQGSFSIACCSPEDDFLGPVIVLPGSSCPPPPPLGEGALLPCSPLEKDLPGVGCGLSVWWHLPLPLEMETQTHISVTLHHIPFYKRRH